MKTKIKTEIMEFKGTKGKWEFVEHSWSDTSLISGDYTIATKSIYDEATEENQEELETEVQYNFLLISKAPEILEMLQKIVLMTETCNGTFEDFRERYNTEIKQVIKEATEL